MKYTSNISQTLPTVSDLNQLTASQNCFILLSVLGTSDFTFMYALFKKDTLEDILTQIEGIRSIEADDHRLTSEELVEFDRLVSAIEEHIRNHG